MTASDKSQPFNALCLKCLRSCKQPVSNLLIECPRYYPMPFKVERHRYDQLDLFGEKKPGSKD